MAKGKQAAMAANRRLEATQDHVDRLTEQLAEAKMRARDAEARAAGADLLRQRVRDLEERIANGPDEAALDKLRWWENVRKVDKRRREDALKELFAWFHKSNHSLIDGLTLMERYEVICGVLPRTLAALEAVDANVVRAWAKDGVRFRDDPDMKPDEARKWYAYVKKERHADEALVPDMIDLLAGLQEGFTVEELAEMLPDRIANDEDITPTGYLKHSAREKVSAAASAPDE